MYKLLIVEDNDFERNALEKYIDWELLGIEVLKSAANGQEGLNSVKESKPDIIISDVKMPIMDGVEMSSHIRVVHPQAKFIFCSGYDDVELLKKAIEIRAYNYLIKPVNHNELIHTVRKIVSELIDERIANAELGKIVEQYNSNLHLMQEEFLKNLIFFGKSRYKDENIYSKSNDLKLEMAGRFRVALINLKYEDGISGFDAFGRSMELIQLIRAGLGKKVRLLQAENHEIIVVFYAIKNENKNEHVEKLIKSVNELSKSNSFKYIIGVSETLPSLTDLDKLFRQCSILTKKKTELGYGKALYYTDFINNPPKANQIINEDNIKSEMDDIIVCVCAGTDPEAKIDELVSAISKKTDKLELFHSVFIDLVSSLLVSINNSGYNVEQVFGEKVDLYTLVLSCKTLPDISSEIKQILHKIVDYFAEKKANKEDHIVKEILDVLHKEFDQPITLSYLSERIYLSSNYLRIIFKDKMDISIQNYLTNLRINKAKELLKNGDLKINQVGNRIGYPNSTYFNVVFKSSVGVTPGEYRNKHVTDH